MKGTIHPHVQPVIRHTAERLHIAHVLPQVTT